ncbi:MAG: hypothetical protein RJR37_13415 [Peptococcaceae bacterium MAG4]|jgi:hypothetical protein|nr:hypothetical protein [Peptococcaceae bacterium MAG4]
MAFQKKFTERVGAKFKEKGDSQLPLRIWVPDESGGFRRDPV